MMVNSFKKFSYIKKCISVFTVHVILDMTQWFPNFFACGPLPNFIHFCNPHPSYCLIMINVIFIINIVTCLPTEDAIRIVNWFI
jgi:hypothetical protein